MIAALLLTLLALAMAVVVARSSHPAMAFVIAAASLAVSALLFLPTAWLIESVGIERVHWLYGVARATPLEPPGWIHLFAFAGLGFLIWVGRRDLRNWRGAALVVLLGIAAELAQWLTDGREPKFEDAGLNALGGAVGMILAMACLQIRRWLSPRIVQPKD